VALPFLLSIATTDIIWVVGVPSLGKLLPIGFEFGGVESATSRSQVGEEPIDGHVAEEVEQKKKMTSGKLKNL
jgi:hypothetical protein